MGNNHAITIRHYEVAYRDSKDKYAFQLKNLSKYLKGEILDVGCNQADMKEMLPTNCNYTGLDLFGSPNIVANLEYGLPLHDKTFDCVIALDVLEHIDKIHYVFDELCRVSKSHIIIALPNLYEFRFRIRFLFGQDINYQYTFTPEPPHDRHRWIFNYSSAREFIRYRARKNGFTLKEEFLCFYSYRQKLLRFIVKIAARVKLSPNLFVNSYWAVLTSDHGYDVVSSKL